MIRISSSLLLLVLAGVASAQQLPTVDTYNDMYSDGTNIYMSGVIQAGTSPMEFCNAQFCQPPTHTYSQSATLTSPSGRTATCSSSYSILASQSYYGECGAEIPIMAKQ